MGEISESCTGWSPWHGASNIAFLVSRDIDSVELEAKISLIWKGLNIYTPWLTKLRIPGLSPTGSNDGDFSIWRNEYLILTRKMRWYSFYM